MVTNWLHNSTVTDACTNSAKKKTKKKRDLGGILSMIAHNKIFTHIRNQNTFNYTQQHIIPCQSADRRERHPAARRTAWGYHQAAVIRDSMADADAKAPVFKQRKKMRRIRSRSWNGEEDQGQHI